MQTRLEWIGGVAWSATSDSKHQIIIDGSEKLVEKIEEPDPWSWLSKPYVAARQWTSFRS